MDETRLAKTSSCCARSPSPTALAAPVEAITWILSGSRSDQTGSSCARFERVSGRTFNCASQARHVSARTPLARTRRRTVGGARRASKAGLRSRSAWRYQLIIDGVATDPNQPVLRRLAEDLHRHHLGAISILPGIEADEIASALHTLAEEQDAGKGHSALRLRDSCPIGHICVCIRSRSIAWKSSATNRRLRRAMAAAPQVVPRICGSDLQVRRWRPTPHSRHRPPRRSRPAVAKAIDEHRGTAAYDQVIVGYLLQIAEDAKRVGRGSRALRRRTARLIAALRPETLQRLLAMGGNVAQRRTFVLGATSGMAVDSVVKIIQAAADASGQVISNGLMRMLSKLATHAEFGGEHARPLADGALREQVDRLLSGWQLDDPNPGHGKVLHHLATTSYRRECEVVEASRT